MAIPKGPYIPAASCGYNERYPAEPSKLTETSAKKSDNKIEKKSDNDDNLMMIGTTGLSTGLCFTALAFGGTIIAPTILTVASVAVVGAGVGIAGYYAVEYVKNQFKNTTAPSSNPIITPINKTIKNPINSKKNTERTGKEGGALFGF
jgi:hypothetical protein